MLNAHFDQFKDNMGIIQKNMGNVFTKMNDVVNYGIMRAWKITLSVW